MGSLRVGHDGATSLSLWQPTPVFLPGESQGQESLVGWDTTEATWQQQLQGRQGSVHIKEDPPVNTGNRLR